MINKQVMNIATEITPKTAHGRFTGLLSPLFDRNGRESIANTMSGGARKITQDSIEGGIKANREKNGTIYQSGMGWVLICAGSGGEVNAGGPNRIASATMTNTTTAPNRVSRQAASGQKGTPVSF